MAERKTLADVANASDDWTPEERAFIENADVKPQNKRGNPNPDVSEAPVVLVPKSVRIEQAVDNALTQAVADRKVRGIRPWKQQEIINRALKSWLKAQGYWPE